MWFIYTLNEFATFIFLVTHYKCVTLYKYEKCPIDFEILPFQAIQTTEKIITDPLANLIG